jgi:hypothetical protein
MFRQQNRADQQKIICKEFPIRAWTMFRLFFAPNPDFATKGTL